jgi:hypothetical protein
MNPITLQLDKKNKKMNDQFTRFYLQKKSGFGVSRLKISWFYPKSHQRNFFYLFQNAVMRNQLFSSPLKNV